MANKKTEEKENIWEMVLEMKGIINAALQDAEKFDNGNKSAGTRGRKMMQEIKKKAQEVRVAVQYTKHLM